MRFQSLAWADGIKTGFLPALALSAALHLLLLWPAPPHRPRPAASPLAATLRAAPLVPASAAAPAPEPAPKRKAAVKPAPPRAETSPATVAQEEPPSSAAPVKGADTAAMATGGRALESIAGLDANGMRDYRVSLARAARGYRHYPPLARERGWAGTAEIQIDISPQGRPAQILLTQSSGHDMLDQAALTMVSRAAAAAILPESLRGQAFAVRLPVTFALDDE